MADLCASKDSGGEEASPPAESEPSVNISPKDKYDYLTEYGTQVLCLLTPDEGCSYLSRNFESITGNPEMSCMGKAFFDMVHEDFRARLQELLVSQTDKKEPLAYRCKLRHADKKWYWYLFLIHGRHAPNSDAVVCVMENVHDNMQIQSNLQKAKLEAELALRAREEFLANMSHDLRTPLNAVIGFAQMMESEVMGKLPPAYLDYAKHIHESGVELLSKVDAILKNADMELADNAEEIIYEPERLLLRVR